METRRHEASDRNEPGWSSRDAMRASPAEYLGGSVRTSYCATSRCMTFRLSIFQAAGPDVPPRTSAYSIHQRCPAASIAALLTNVSMSQFNAFGAS
jgi:hypothetical protein